MANGNLEITPPTTVNALLDAYPHLEEELIGIAPPFKKLKNPLLRRSVAKVATMKHISAVGGIPLTELINKLRETVGQSTTGDSFGDEDYFSEKPEWFSADKIKVSINEEKLENKDKMTLVVILQEAKNVKKGEIIELITTFLPAPGIDSLISKGYSVWTVKEDENLIKSYFLKNTD
jgi:hypothetical protein